MMSCRRSLALVGWVLVAGALPLGATGMAAASSNGRCVPVAGVTDKCPAWVKALAGNTPVGNRATDIAVGPSSRGDRVYVTGFAHTGSTLNNSTGQHGMTVAYTAGGRVLWKAPNDYVDTTRLNAQVPISYGPRIRVSPDGRRVYVGWDVSQQNSSATNYAVTAYDASTGAQLWQATYDGPSDTADALNAMELSPDGSTIYVTGGSETAGWGTSDLTTVAYDAATGAQRWVARFAGPTPSGQAYGDVANALAVSPDGSKVMVTGQVQASPCTSYGCPTEWMALGYDSITGQLLWSHAFGQGDSPGNLPYAVRISRDGTRAYVTGRLDVAGHCPRSGWANWGTVAYDTASGTQLWSQVWSGPAQGGLNFPAAMAVDDHDRVLITGKVSLIDASGTCGSAYGTVAYDGATGLQLWSQVDAGPSAPTYSDLPFSVMGDSIAFSAQSGNVYVTGESMNLLGDGITSYTFGTVAYAASSGTQQWAAIFADNGTPHAGGSGDGANAIAVSPTSQSVYVTGGFGPPAGAKSFCPAGSQACWGTLAYAGP